MLFNSAAFLFVFLPATWVGFRLVVRFAGGRAAAGLLSLASLVYYGWWDWHEDGYYLPLLLASLLINYVVARAMLVARRSTRKAWLVAGIVWNLGLLGYFKYAHFFLENAAALTGTSFVIGTIVLPLGISFYTFQLIAFLVDIARGRVASINPLDYTLFVLFFPQLIAGPIVHHTEFIPQLRARTFGTVTARGFAIGLAVFSAGLFQKCVIADTIAPIAETGFGLAAAGTNLRFQEAWVALAAYSMQLLNDFAGYSHMAIGLALMFGLRLPINFMAPYTAGNIIDFWRRWHITLSAFLRDYVYIPLGGNRHRHLTNVFLTMLLAGLWHGAGWTFILWGAWHGAAVCINHAWRRRHSAAVAPATPRLWARATTVLTVVLGWTLFRSPDLETARSFAASLAGLNGITVPVSLTTWVESLAPFVRPRGLFPAITATPTMLIVLVLAVFFAFRGPRLLAFFGVTSRDVVAGESGIGSELAPASSRLAWGRFVVAGLMLALAIATLARTSPFLYYQF